MNSQQRSSCHGTTETNPARSHEIAGLIPGLAQWISGYSVAMSCGVGCRYSSDLVLLWLLYGPVAVAHRPAAIAPLDPSLGISICRWWGPKKKKKEKKNSQQNFSKPNPTTHKKDHTPWPSGINSKFTGMVQHMQTDPTLHSKKKKKVKNLMIISIYAEKAFDKNSISIYDPNSYQCEYRGKTFQYNKSHLWQTCSQYNTQWKKAEILPTKICNKTGCSLLSFLFNIVLDFLAWQLDKKKKERETERKIQVGR